MAWQDALKTLAPTVATALGGPLAGAAITAIGSIFGMSSPTADTIGKMFADGRLTADHLAEIRKLELDYQNQERERGFKYAELEFKNQDSARQMQIATRSRTPDVLAVIIVAGFFSILVSLMLGVLKVSENQSLLILLGALSAGFGSVLNFFFGSSNGSQNKDVLLANSTPHKENNIR